MLKRNKVVIPNLEDKGCSSDLTIRFPIPKGHDFQNENMGHYSKGLSFRREIKGREFFNFLIPFK